MNNEQAFPTQLHGGDGMTLRDYFAAKAMQGLLANGWCSEQREIAPTMGEHEVAQDAYRLADAMLKARKA